MTTCNKGCNPQANVLTDFCGPYLSDYCRVDSIMVTNWDSGTIHFWVALAPQGLPDDHSHYMYSNVALAAGAAIPVFIGRVANPGAQGDIVRVKADSSKVNFNSTVTLSR